MKRLRTVNRRGRQAAQRAATESLDGKREPQSASESGSDNSDKG
jgi:hypothetical protein